MTHAEPNTPDPARTITRGGWWFLAIWTLGILLLYGICGTLSTLRLLEYRSETWRVRKASLASLAADSAAAAAAGAPTRPVDVHVGLSLDRISEIDAKEGGWTADFHIWFRWTGDGVDPGRHFQVSNGRILEREEVMAYAAGGERYAQYRVTARLVASFDAARAPVGDQTLSIQIEDAVDGAGRLRYVMEARDVDLRRVAAPMGLSIADNLATVTTRQVGTARRDPRAGDAAALHSLFVVIMVVKSAVVWTYLRMFQALFASVAICMIVFFIKPTHVDPRFGLPVGAFFAAVGNNISIVSSMPQTGQMTLVQMVNATGLGTIFLTLVQSAMSLYLLDTRGRERFQQTFDRVSFVVLCGSYAVLNVVLPFAARS